MTVTITVGGKQAVHEGKPLGSTQINPELDLNLHLLYNSIHVHVISMNQ